MVWGTEVVLKLSKKKKVRSEKWRKNVKLTKAGLWICGSSLFTSIFVCENFPTKILTTKSLQCYFWKSRTFTDLDIIPSIRTLQFQVLIIIKQTLKTFKSIQYGVYLENMNIQLLEFFFTVLNKNRQLWGF